MSVGNSPMMMVLYLSPGIIKRNNLEVREKVWKVSDVAQQTVVQVTSESKEEKQPEIIKVYCKNKDGVINVPQLLFDYTIDIYAETKNTQIGDIVKFIISDDLGNTIEVKGFVGEQGIAKCEYVNLLKMN